MRHRRFFGRFVLVALVATTTAAVWAASAEAADVTLSVSETFATADASDGTVDNTFTVNGNLTITGSGAITCNDPPSTNASSPCASPSALRIVVHGNFVMQAGALIQAENLSLAGAGGAIQITVDGNSTIAGKISSSKIVGTDTAKAGDITFATAGDLVLQSSSQILAETPAAGGSGGAINISAANMAMQGTAKISSSNTGNGQAGDITIDVGDYPNTPQGVFSMENGSQILADSSGTAGDVIITSGKSMEVDGLIRSASTSTGGGTGRGGGVIRLDTGCVLDESETGVILSQGKDPGADLVHLSGCEVTVKGVVASIALGGGHALPANPPNSCNNDNNTLHPLNGASFYTACVEIWGKDVTIDSTSVGGALGADGVSADGVRNPGRAWIDVFADADVNIIGSTSSSDPYAVHANACDGNNAPNAPCSNSFGGLLTVKAGDQVNLTGRALQATGLAAGSNGGNVIVHAGNNVTLNSASIDATAHTGSVGDAGGTIEVRSFNGTVTGTGSLQARGDAGTSPGSVDLISCSGVSFVGTVDPAETPAQLLNNMGVCGGAPAIPATSGGVQVFHRELWEACNQQPTFTISGRKHKDTLAGAGLPNWTIRLYDSGGGLLFSTTTDGNGDYTLGPVGAGTYKVCEVLMTGWTEVSPSGGNPACTAVDEAGTGITVVITNANSTGNDFANSPPRFTISGTKHKDTLAGAGLPNWTFRLYSGTTLLQTKTSNASGLYAFDPVEAGTYRVCEVLMAGWTEVAPSGGSPACTAADEAGTGITVVITNANSTGNDFANSPPRFTISGTKHKDTLAGAGLPNWTFRLYSGTTLLQTKTSNASGLYAFDPVEAGTYRVCEVLMAGWTEVAPSGGSPACTAVDEAGTGITVVITNANSTGNDFANSPPRFTISGTKHKDTLAGAGLPNWTFRLYDSSNALVDAAVSGAGGAYVLGPVEAGTYRVCEVLMTGWTEVAPSGGSPACTAADEAGTGITVVITNANVTGKDFANAPPRFTISGVKHQDTLAGAGLPGWTINLYSGSVLVATTTTGAGGVYSFTGLDAGAYRVCEVQMTGWMETSPTIGPPCSGPNEAAVGIDVTVGPSSPNNDFANRPPSMTCTIGDYVWKDMNGNGIQDDGDANGANGVLVELLDGSGNPTGLTTTTADFSAGRPGYYLFTGIPCGTYKVRVAASNFAAGGPLESKLPTQRFVGSDTAIDSNGDANSTSEAFSVANPPPPGQNLTIDFGYLCPTTICVDGKFGGNLYTEVLPGGNIRVTFDQFTNFNDNSYGLNAVGWGGPNKHTFGNLTGSDKAQFVFKNGNGATVLDFTIDYISCASTGIATPSKCATLGYAGGDGSFTTGTKAWVLSYDTSLDMNLNDLGFCSAGSCVAGTSNTDLKVNSPPVNPAETYMISDPALAAWNFHNVYQVVISKDAFAGSGFGSVSVPLVHNSPAKANATCPSSATQSICAPGKKLKSIDFKYNTGGTCAASTNQQGDKFKCTDVASLTSPARVVVMDRKLKSNGTVDPGAKKYFDGIVNNGGTFTAASANAGQNQFPADIYMAVFNGSGQLLQSMQMKADCSQPVAIGDTFGSLEVTGGTHT